MADEQELKPGVHECGHAVEAHSDANGCELCECGESLGRDFIAASGNGQGASVSAPTAEGGATDGSN